MRHILFICGAVAILAGCQSARVAQPVIQQVHAEPDESGLAFWHALPAAGTISNDDAFHALLLYFDGRDAAGGYDARVASLKQRGWLAQSFNDPADAAVQRGTVAAALVEAMDIKGGLVLRALGPSPRYATRELQYMNLYPLSSPQQTFSGVQLVELVSKVEDWQETHRSMESPQPPLPHEAPPPSTRADAAQRIVQITGTRGQIMQMLLSLTASPMFIAQAQPAAPEAAPAPVDPNALEITVTSVQGLVQVRAAEGQPWQPAQAGQKLTAGAEFRTGPRSAVQFTVGPTQTITLDRLGTVKVLDAIRRADGGVTTDVGMKYGRTTMQVQAAGIEHQSQIRSPGATLSVRGSIGALEDIGGTLRAAGLEGDVGWTDRQGQFRKLPPNSEHEGGEGSTAENRLADGAFSPSAFGVTPLEQFLYSYYTGGTFESSQIGAEVFRQQLTSAVPTIPDESTGGFENATIFLPLIFRLFDNGAQDGDIVTLTVRDRGGAVLGPVDVSLTNAGQSFAPEDVQTGRVEITIFAVNQGSSGLNTGGLEIQSEVLEGLPFQTYNLTTGESGTLILDARPAQPPAPIEE